MMKKRETSRQRRKKEKKPERKSRMKKDDEQNTGLRVFTAKFSQENPLPSSPRKNQNDERMKRQERIILPHSILSCLFILASF
jgi:hypothetical protein